jgi:hypothetical protein
MQGLVGIVDLLMSLLMRPNETIPWCIGGFVVLVVLVFISFVYDLFARLTSRRSEDGNAEEQSRATGTRPEG